MITLDDLDFEQLIGSRDIKVEELIEYIADPKYRNVIDGLISYHLDWTINPIAIRWPEAEQYFMLDAEVACSYIRNVLRRRWPEAEPVILADPEWGPLYRRDVLDRD